MCTKSAQVLKVFIAVIKVIEVTEKGLMVTLMLTWVQAPTEQGMEMPWDFSHLPFISTPRGEPEMMLPPIQPTGTGIAVLFSSAEP